MLNPDYESEHTGYISKLISLYGTEREPEIRDLYNQNRVKLEEIAKINHDQVPFFTYQQTERILGKPKTTPPKIPESAQQEQPKVQRKRRRGLGLSKILF